MGGQTSTNTPFICARRSSRSRLVSRCWKPRRPTCLPALGGLLDDGIPLQRVLYLDGHCCAQRHGHHAARLHLAGQWPYMPVAPNTLASRIYYICDSVMLRDFERLSMLGAAERDRRVKRVARLYHLSLILLPACQNPRSLSSFPYLATDLGLRGWGLVQGFRVRVSFLWH